MTDQKVQPTPPTWIELESIVKPAVVERITSLSWDTIKRRYPDRIRRPSQGREGMKLRDALWIADQQQADAA